ncbi:hypothetical protein TL16_g04175 [Triparma laevis f. inornata]|uniref:Uncharacterized protein n=1 Tax=Triparma laevis f. inornata TaxID=1714386 RepID=A0A9W7E4Y0_9STRA|nr:hypothetical protein TL16_g04175 [Triparma laevis f. inornata]
MLDSRGVELGKVTSWARAQAEISKNNPKVENGSLMVGGRLVRNRNLGTKERVTRKRRAMNSILARVLRLRW